MEPIPKTLALIAIGLVIIVLVGLAGWSILAGLTKLCRWFPNYSKGLRKWLEKIDSLRWHKKLLIAVGLGVIIYGIVALIEFLNPGWTESW